jgi:hypothetical protein
MAYIVQWQLVGRSGRALDCGCIGEDLCDYSDAVAAVHEFLRPYPVVIRCGEANYWKARRSSDADLGVWVWIECRGPPDPLSGCLMNSGSVAAAASGP